MGLKFKCGICKKKINNGRKFSVESTEWETETTGCGGGIDIEAACLKCNSEIKEYIDLMIANSD